MDETNSNSRVMQTSEGVQILDARLESLESSIASRLDRIESKLDSYSVTITSNSSKIEHLQGGAKIIVTILLAVGGFLAAAYFK